MSRHTNMKGFLEEADEEGQYQDCHNGQENYEEDLTVEQETLVENLEFQFQQQFSKDTIIDVLDSENWNEAICVKILEESLELYTQFAGQIKLDVLVHKFYDAYWKKSDCIKILQAMVEEKNKKQQEKDKKQQQISKQQQKKKQEEEQQQIVLQKQSSTNSSHRKASYEEKKENQIQKQLQRDYHSIKIERFQQETDVKVYNKIYGAIDHKQKFTLEEQQHSSINLVTVGHVDSGKSTLIGHFRHLMNSLDKREMHKLEKISNENNKNSFKYAYGQDEFDQERERGVTIDVGFKTIKTTSNEINFLDSPGHRDFVPNMISGTAQADYALLVVDSGPNAFEGGFEKGGQTKEHAYLIKAFGVEKVIVAINKMDLHQWSKERYMEVYTKVVDYLLSIGFKSNQIRSIPISGFSGQNLVKKCQVKEAAWYTGNTLLELLESLKPPMRAYEKPTRFNIYSSSNKKNQAGLCIQGKMEGGVLAKGDKIIIQPHGIIAQVKDLLINTHKESVVKSGDNLEAQIQLKHDIEERYINSGNVICGMKLAIPITKHVVAEFVAFDLIYPILKGAEVMVYINTSRTDGFLFKINKLIDKDNGAVLKKSPKCIKSHECAEIQVKFGELMCAELYANFNIYGRIILRDNKQTIGVGTIKEIL
uniref:Elongation factor Tu protein n=1 Tax=Philasterides dicentrarchi TaxID=282688 RepID=A0A481SI26_9CILI|nr:elongation factor Tu protein [Philasterides dicentrarchi]